MGSKVVKLVKVVKVIFKRVYKDTVVSQTGHWRGQNRSQGMTFNLGSLTFSLCVCHGDANDKIEWDVKTAYNQGKTI